MTASEWNPAPVTASVADGRFILTGPNLMKDLYRQIPGVRYHRSTDTWRGPLSWATALAARAVLGADLALDASAVAWGTEEAKSVAQSAAIKGKPWPEQEYGFQEIDIEWLNTVERAVLGNEPGTGKTRIATMAMTFPALVICTNSMKYRWAMEIEQWRPGTRVVVLEGSAAKRRKYLEIEADCYVVNWESLRTLSKLEGYGSIRLSEKEKTPGPLNRHWATVVADEVHAAKDPGSKQTRAYWAIMHDSDRRYGLSGTIAPENPGNIWPVMHGIEEAEYPSMTQWRERFTLTAPAFWGGADTILGLRADTRAEFFQVFDRRFLRRTKAEALPWLPEKVYTTRYIEMDAKQRRAYDDLEKLYVAETDGGLLTATGAGPHHIRLLQAASATPVLQGVRVDKEGDEHDIVGLTAPSNKVNALLDLISESPNEPLVVFSASRLLLDLVAAALDKKVDGVFVPYGFITGDRTPQQREQTVQDFQAGALQVVLATPGAGGAGITLHRAQKLVVLASPEKAVERVQLEDRVHRIGQTGQVEIIDFISLDTIEHDLHLNLGRKADLAQEIMRDPNYVRRLIEARPKKER